ncbi:MAG: bifunctional 2-keto-4-hydroxyglutarate aldolase/2-keto-3-deoxy-6-phosphogluconate aldolase [Dehalococcoidales bacterium]|jgi:2-dehydro-3-deoxyphosphogluconate aldolase/(4S)-4-hydroxy-2-oxoglutarate aldolase|nr:bifunctional 2-keto-4-hydroxyglutarate aldolase/2-keto-3-deoxy-6-phosphogluconate aldolase [Dehalococcoidales bacterium]MDP6449072.1 bifunctional 2-keto-4-hydroxyglutarate aldolase/2-keto-3-deoxy-6-phosphogluconate aldolase [Dehalococcoidales bacterium]MDP6577076.1 bifunctional 2-keto-4-hydroxyglutarate aldolase/2-keto-3-deoxy-6-phosphogluconate aldolase [Dehalococcoidales bacterium]|tara:strand:+ start:314 stop:958 length:645 start_codon:yes stop_codon:yes gene_type:complete
MRYILEGGIIAIIRAPDVERGYNLAEAARRGGITAIEITMTVPRALDVIRDLASRYCNGEILVGAGTVLDPETARLAILSGAEYIISPHFDLATVQMCHRYRKVCIPGAMSVKEVVEVLESGADAVKIFPAGLFGPSIIKAIREPLPQVMMIPTGGISLDNVAEWFEAGAVAVAVGGDLTQETLAKGDYGILEQKAKDYIARIKEVRKKLKAGK